MQCFVVYVLGDLFFFFKQKTAYEMRISDWSSDVCSSDLRVVGRGQFFQRPDQGFDDEAPAVAAEVATGVGPGVVVDRAGVRRGGMVRIAHLSIPFATAEIGRASCRERVCQYV